MLKTLLIDCLEAKLQLQLFYQFSLQGSLGNDYGTTNTQEDTLTTSYLIPVVNTKVLFPLDRDIGISYCRLLLHSSMLKDDCYRFGISATPVCVCGADRETSEHFLLHGNIHKKTRIELFEQIHQITASKDIHRTVTTSEVSEQISKKQNRLIKDLLFEFISSTKRAL